MSNTNTIKYPEINVELIGHDGNAFAILGKVKKALARNGVHPTIQKEFMDEATAGDYDHLLQTVMEYVDVS